MSGDGICVPAHAHFARDIPANAQVASSAATIARPTPGASGLNTPPQPAQTEPEIPVSVAEGAETAARSAKIACDELQDARIIFDAINRAPAATSLEIAAAELRLQLAQNAADAVVAQNLKAQEALDAENALKLKTAVDDEAAGLNRRGGPASADLDGAKLAELDRKRNLAFQETVSSGRGVAVALSLQKIAMAVLPGRKEFAEDISLEDAQSATAKLKDAYEALSRFEYSGIREVRQHMTRLQEAASANRVTWAALHDNAIRSGNAALKKQSEKGLEDAELQLRYVNSPDFLKAYGL
jgi:hypothetical protein